MRKLLTFVAVLLLAVPVTGKTSENDVIGKSNIKLSSRMMTPEALWAMGRIGSYEASPDGQHVVYQVGYYSVKQNKSHQVIYGFDMMFQKRMFESGCIMLLLLAKRCVDVV